MAYLLKNPTEFKKDLNTYLNDYPLKSSFEEEIINNFSSNNLSDLYQLFLDLKGATLNKELYNSLKNILRSNFSIEPNFIFTVEDDEKESIIFDEAIYIPRLLEIIKNSYLNYINELKETSSVDENELYRLSLIMNKHFPKMFLELIKSPNQDIKKSQAFITDKILKTIDHWHSHNSKEAENENRDIAGAFYITARKLYPDLNIFIPGRIKSMKSSISNIEKEIKENLDSLMSSEQSTGLTDDDIEEQFNLDDANTDFSGFTVVLANTDDTLHFDKTDPKSAEVLELRKIRNENINFTHSLENFLAEHDDYIFSNLELYQIKIDLLERLRASTYEECTREYKNTSFAELLKSAIIDYDKEFQEPSSSQISDDGVKYMMAIDEIYELLDELKKRVHDKYQAKLLEIAIPDILADDIFSNTLKVTSYMGKKIKKKNGFCSNYYYLETADGRKIELQAQSKKRFEDSKNGPADHSLLPNKQIDISRFFEPINPEYTKDNFEYFLNVLNTTPIATKNHLFNTHDAELSPIDKRLKRKLKIAEQNIKLKDNIDIELPIFAEYVSPRLMTVSSHHTRFHKSVAGYNKKSLVSGFTEVLLKHDSTTCLAQMLIDKLETLIPSDKNQISLNGINKRSKLRHSNDKEKDDR